MNSNKIPGVPEGWEAVSFDYVSDGEHWLDKDGDPIQHTSSVRTQCKRLIIRKIVKPAKYRPFKDAEEFKPHRDRWIRQKESDSIFRVITYDEDGLFALIEIVVDPFCWEEAFEDFVFDDDGTPFGVRIDGE
jgi:hypothetical protein